VPTDELDLTPLDLAKLLHYSEKFPKPVRRQALELVASSKNRHPRDNEALPRSRLWRCSALRLTTMVTAYVREPVPFQRRGAAGAR
jgi:hypothetical protein